MSAGGKLAAGKVRSHDMHLCASYPRSCTLLNCVLLLPSCPPACPPLFILCRAHRSLGLRRSHTLSTRPDPSVACGSSKESGNRVRSRVGRTQQRVVGCLLAVAMVCLCSPAPTCLVCGQAVELWGHAGVAALSTAQGTGLVG